MTTHHDILKRSRERTRFVLDYDLDVDGVLYAKKREITIELGVALESSHAAAFAMKKAKGVALSLFFC